MTTLIVAADLATALPDVPSGALAPLPAIATAAVENYCQRPLALANRDEEYTPGFGRIVRLKGYPIVTVNQVLTDLATVLTVVSAPGPWRATVSVSIGGDETAPTPTALVLASNTAGQTTTATFELATYPTIQLLANAINTQGGWTATVASGMGACPSSEIRPTSGTYDALKRPREVSAYLTTLGDYEIRPKVGRLTLRQIRPDSYQFPGRTFGVSGHASLVRVQYSAGYNGDSTVGPVTTPPDLAEACIQAARGILDARTISGVLKSVSLGNTSYEAGDIQAIPDSARGLLSDYCDRRF